MGASVIALCRAYLKTAAASSTAWLAIGAAVLYTAMATSSTAITLRTAGIDLRLIEAGLYTFSDAYLLTFGMLFCYMIVVIVAFQPTALERLLLHRMDRRQDVWVARGLAVLGLAAVFLCGVAMVWFVLALPIHSPSVDWGRSYRQVLAAVDASPSGLAPVYYLAADPQVFSTFTPLEAAGLKAGHHLLVFWAVGALCVVVGQASRRAAITFTALFGYLFSYLIANASGLHWFAYLTPQFALLGDEMTRQRPLATLIVTAGLWASILAGLLVTGARQIRRVVLG